MMITEWYDEKPEEWRETIEKVDPAGSGFGFQIRWMVQDHWANFEVHEITATDGEGDDKIDSEMYLSGHIKMGWLFRLEYGPHPPLRPAWPQEPPRTATLSLGPSP